MNASAVAVPDADAQAQTRVKLRSAFQPIFSLSHQRIVGHEALIRATDPRGNPIPPKVLFDGCRTVEALRLLDETCLKLHTHGFASSAGAEAQWLFLNVDASLFTGRRLSSPAETMAKVAARARLEPRQIVIEILEGAVPEGPEFEAEVSELRDLGFLVALDDFGAGHSNFDRVFRLRPHIVKLDRSVIIRATHDDTVRRVTAQMISLLHECGALVLVEGVETSEEAYIALDADADFVQGFHFATPSPNPMKSARHSQAMQDVWDVCEARADVDMRHYKERVRPYAEALMHARDRLEAGASLASACDAFLSLEDSDVCYVLDARGLQVGDNLYREPLDHQPMLQDQFAPLQDTGGACWSRRPYFRRAVAAPGMLQVTRPYLTMQSLRMCVTLSLSFETRDGSMLILCADMVWRSNVPRPTFGATQSDPTF
jgi:EAL domain-containing protein (putative c-di-GMP-specific phosphodiesterase class I)